MNIDDFLIDLLLWIPLAVNSTGIVWLPWWQLLFLKK